MVEDKPIANAILPRTTGRIGICRSGLEKEHFQQEWLVGDNEEGSCK
jgi:hypothetical protein